MGTPFQETSHSAVSVICWEEIIFIKTKSTDNALGFFLIKSLNEALPSTLTALFWEKKKKKTLYVCSPLLYVLFLSCEKYL